MPMDSIHRLLIQSFVVIFTLYGCSTENNKVDRTAEKNGADQEEEQEKKKEAEKSAADKEKEKKEAEKEEEPAEPVDEQKPPQPAPPPFPPADPEDSLPGEDEIDDLTPPGDFLDDDPAANITGNCDGFTSDAGGYLQCYFARVADLRRFLKGKNEGWAEASLPTSERLITYGNKLKDLGVDQPGWQQSGAYWGLACVNLGLARLVTTQVFSIAARDGGRTAMEETWDYLVTVNNVLSYKLSGALGCRN